MVEKKRHTHGRFGVEMYARNPYDESDNFFKPKENLSYISAVSLFVPVN